MPAPVGLLFLDDLESFAPWSSDRAPAWAAARGLSGALREPTILPPPVLVLVARALTWSELEQAVDWLALARVIVLVLDRSDDVASEDPEIGELLALELEDLRARLDRPLELIEVGAAGIEAAIDAGLERGRARAEALGELSWPGFAGAWVEESPARPGPWLPWRGPAPEYPSLEQIVGAVLCREPEPAVLDAVAGERLRLRDGAREAVAGLEAGEQGWWPPIAALPDGRRWLRWEAGREPRWAVVEEGGEARVCPGGWGRAIGVDASGRVAWTGGRGWFNWRVLSERGPALWTPSSHDWPCGHAKKLYGYEDNDPLSVQLSADGRACLSTYEHDTLLTPGLPLRWRELDGFALAERARGEPRALLFRRAAGDEGFPGDPFAADEDARDTRVVASLGPSARARYVIGLDPDIPSYRLVGGVVSELGRGREWLVCAEDHSVVRRAPGRLLAGWGPWVVVEDGGRLWREDLRAQARVDLGEAGRDIAGAVALPGTGNVVLISDGSEPELRLL